MLGLASSIEKHIELIPESTCWWWNGTITRAGYGQISRHPFKKAHRVIYETLAGKIPEGLVLDHLCRNRSCVNPSHLEIVTQAENVRRGVGVGRIAGLIQRSKTQCPSGHPYAKYGIGRPVTKDHPKGGRVCRLCRAESKNQYRARKRNAGL